MATKTVTFDSLPQTELLLILLERKNLIPKNGTGFVSIGESFFNDFAELLISAFPGENEMVMGLLQPYEMAMALCNLCDTPYKDGAKFNPEALFSLKFDGQLSKVYGPAIMAGVDGNDEKMGCVLQVGVNRYWLQYDLNCDNTPALHSFPQLKTGLKITTQETSSGDTYAKLSIKANVPYNGQTIPCLIPLVTDVPKGMNGDDVEASLEAGTPVYEFLRNASTSTGGFIKLRDTEPGDVYRIVGVETGKFGLILRVDGGAVISCNTALKNRLQSIIDSISQTPNHPNYDDPVAGVSGMYSGGYLVIRSHRKQEVQGADRTIVDASIYTESAVKVLGGQQFIDKIVKDSFVGELPPSQSETIDTTAKVINPTLTPAPTVTPESTEDIPF